MATGSISVYQAGKEVLNSTIGSFAEGTPNRFTVTLPVSATTPQFVRAAENGTRFQQVYLVMGTFQMTFDSVMVVSINISSPNPSQPEHATITFAYQSSQPGKP